MVLIFLFVHSFFFYWPPCSNIKEINKEIKDSFEFISKIFPP